MRPISSGNCATVASIVPGDRLPRVVDGVEAEDPDLARLAAAAIASTAPSAIMSLQAKTVSMSRMRLQHVLEDGEALVALPVRGLRGHDLSSPALSLIASLNPRTRESPVSCPGMPSSIATLALPPVAFTRYSPSIFPPS